jgi:putative copper resistance protein D
MTTAVLSLTRSLHMGGAMMLFALPCFMLFILRPVLATDQSESYTSFCRSMTRWFRVALALEVISGVVWFWFIAAQINHQSPWRMLTLADLDAVLWQSPFGGLWLLRGLIAVALGVMFYFASRGDAFASPRPSPLNWLVIAASACLLLSLAWTGHIAAGFHRQILHLLSDAPHLLIGAIWPVGLIPMAYFLWYIGRHNRILPTDREVESLQRFSQTSLVAVTLLFLTGAINGWLMIGSWQNLVGTWNGQLLLGKLLLVTIMIGMGAFNRFHLLPGIHDMPLLFRTLRKTVVAESCLGLLVLCIVGMHT